MAIRSAFLNPSITLEIIIIVFRKCIIFDVNNSSTDDVSPVISPENPNNKFSIMLDLVLISMNILHIYSRGESLMPSIF